MKITNDSKSIIYFRAGDAARVGKDCFYLDAITWLNSEGIELGNRVSFNIHCYVNGLGGLVIGDVVGIGPNVLIHTANHRAETGKPIMDQGWEKRPVKIGSNCFIGMGTVIVPGVTIGDNVVIGAGSVVVKDIPSNTLAAGNPCKVIRQRK